MAGGALSSRPANWQTQKDTERPDEPRLCDVTGRGLGAAGAVARAVDHVGPATGRRSQPEAGPGAEAGAAHWQGGPMARGKGTTPAASWAPWVHCLRMGPKVQNCLFL